MFSLKTKLVAASIVMAAASASQAAIVTLGTSGGGTVPTIVTTGADPINLGVYLSAQGTGFVNAMSVGVYASSAATWAGGQINAGNPLPASGFVTASSFAYSAERASYLNQSVGTVNNTAVTGATIVRANIGGTANSAPPIPVTASVQALIGTLTLSVTTVPGTYYLYLGRTGSGVTESPAFSEGAAIAQNSITTGTTFTGQSSRFGVGDLAVATSGAGSLANTTGSIADAIIVVVPEPTSLSMLGLGALGLMSRRRKA